MAAILDFMGSAEFDLDVAGVGMLVLVASLVYSLWSLRRA